MKTDATKPLPISRSPWLWLAGLFLLALLVRVWRLNWQPLWWDEGYSIYFATESFGRMLWLTAHDIHPPLYYALLQFWTLLFGGAEPLVVRSISVLLSAASVPALFWMTRQYFPQSARTAWVAALLLAVSPMHLFYSQEVRMYALATLLAILAAGFLWKGVKKKIAGVKHPRAIIFHAIALLALLYTLYYGALLMLAMGVWLVWALWWRRDATLRSAFRYVALWWIGVLSAFSIWLVYALPKLIPYIEQKVASDQDVALGLAAYVTRHLNAFVAGHVQDAAALERWAALLGVLGIALLTFALIVTTRNGRGALRGVRMSDTPALAASPALALFAIIPFLAAFVINLVNPFFPDGGERLLLFVLPFALSLIAHGIDLLIWRLGWLGWAPLVPLLAAAGIGIFIFYTTPRHAEEDYRPLISDIVHAGRDSDTIFATFPWQVGYWRAYKPRDVEGPDTFLMSPFAIEYSPQLERDLQWMLAEGTLWFPEPLAFGSSLPQQMEEWLAANSANLENRWYSLTTRLTAWSDLELPRPGAPAVQFGDITLMGSEVGAEEIAADNSPLPIVLLWDQGSVEDGEHGVTLRLQDDLGRTWASRDYAPLGAFAQTDEGDLPLAIEHMGLIVPPGTPGIYQLKMGVTEGERLVEGTADDGQEGDLIALGSVEVVNPTTTLPLGRFDMGTTVRNPHTSYGLTVVGFTTPVSPTLAGALLPVSIFARKENAAPFDREIEVFLQEDAGTSMWRGWPLPDYPTSQWQMGLPARVPVSLRVSPYLASGTYNLKMRWLNAENSEASPLVDLGTVVVQQRASADSVAPPSVLIEPSPQFGGHALLRGHTLEQSDGALNLKLTWEVMQPLVPEHNVFVHLDAPGGATIAQQDGPPVTDQGVAPTSTWRPGETIVTEHSVTLPDGGTIDNAVLRVGLYEPVSEVRLPVSVDGVAKGDSVEIAIP